MTVVWCDPPPVTHSRAWFPLLEETATRPGSWAMLRRYQTAEQAYDAASHLRRVKTRKPAGQWKFRTGRVPDAVDEWAVWARCGSEL